MLILILGGIFIIRHQSVERIKYEYEIAISRPETAIAITRAVLIEHFPQRNNQYEHFNFTAEENDGVWIVRGTVPRPDDINDNETFVLYGVAYYVHIRESNGEILEIRRE